METKTALITGATGGIGREFAKILAQKGHQLILVAKDENKLQRLIKIIQKKHMTHQYFVCDLSCEKDLISLTKKHPQVDLLVNNAGFGDYGFYPELVWKNQKQMIQVNVIAVTYLCHFYLGAMLKKGRGQIINVSSTAGTHPAPFNSCYGGTKAFIIQFSKSLALELKGTNITVSCLLPGPTATQFWKKANMWKKVKEEFTHFDKPGAVAKYGIDLVEKRKTSGVYGFKNKAKQLIKNLLPEKVWFLIVRRHMLSKTGS